MQEWRNWQTRRLQVHVVAISCGFKSHLLHFRKVSGRKDLRLFSSLYKNRFPLAAKIFQKKSNFLLTISSLSCNIYFVLKSTQQNTEMQEWRNWQTRRLQVPVVAISCGFKSHFLHYFFVK